jgi:hypothetical protein
MMTYRFERIRGYLQGIVVDTEDTQEESARSLSLRVRKLRRLG